MGKGKWERVLTLVVLALLGLLVGNWVWDYAEARVGEIARREEALRTELDTLRRGSALGVREQAELERLQRTLASSATDSQNEFSRFLADQAPQGVRKVVPQPPVPLKDRPQLQVLTFQLQLRLKLRELVQLLGQLDAAEKPLAVELLKVLPTDQVDEALAVDLTISTLVPAEVKTP